MTKEQVISLIKSRGHNNDINFLREYCLEKGKASNMTEVFLMILVRTNQLNYYVDAAIECLIQEMNIVILRDKQEKIILVY